MQKKNNLRPAVFGAFPSPSHTLYEGTKNNKNKTAENKKEKINACFILDKKINNKINLKAVASWQGNSSVSKGCDNTPILFNKKSKNIIAKPMKYIEDEFGFSKHFTPAAQEWHNSVCSYNYTYYKSLPVWDRNLFSLLKSYFNLHLNPKPVKAKVTKNKKKGKKVYQPKPMPIRYRRLSICRTFIGKGDVKHTSQKAILTFYVYDLEGMLLRAKYKKEFRELVTARLSYEIIRNKKTKELQVVYKPIRPGIFYWPFPHTYADYLKYVLSYVKKYTSPYDKIKKYYKFLASLVRKNLLTLSEKKWMIKEELLKLSDKSIKKIRVCAEQKNSPISSVCKAKGEISTFEKMSDWYINIKKIRDRRRVNKNIRGFSTFEKMIWVRKIQKLEKYKNLIFFNQKKIQMLYLQKLIRLIEMMYDKKVELNIVNLNRMHLNSDIFTQAVSLRLRNRDNKVYRVLKASLRNIKIWPINKIKEKNKKRNKEELHINQIRNNIISSMFTDDEVKDPLGDLLLEFFPHSPAEGQENSGLYVKVIKKFYSKTFSVLSLRGYILGNLSQKKLRGIRIEAKGRLTRRFTASRSIYKMKWLGGLKNADSSFRGWPAILLRGHVKSNVEYSIINSKNRNGAYGVKGWVSTTSSCAGSQWLKINK